VIGRVWSRRALVAVLAVSAPIVASGCLWFARTTPPDWIEGSSREYGSERYLIGVGQADSQPEAASRAYAALSRIFKAEISAQSKDWESFLLLEKKGAASTERRLTLDQVTRVSTDKVLENIRLLDTWKDPRGGRHYALAGMDRAQAGAAMQERISELDREVQGAIQESRQTSDKLAAVRALRRALKNLVVREAHNADLRVIRTSGQGIESSYHVAELTAQLEQAMTANLVIGVDVAGDQADAVRRAVMEGLVREGLPVTAGRVGGGSPAGSAGEAAPLELLVTGTVRLWPVTVPDPRFKYARWCSDFVIVERATKRVVGAVSRGGREGHLTEAEAMAKAGRVMQQEITSDLAKTLAGYVYGDAMPAVVPPPSACVVGEKEG
jgi:hypothetical protein